MEDEDVPTEGGQPHSYWLRYGPSVVLATGEQLRFASEDELLAAHCVPDYAVNPDQVRGARQYVDVRPASGFVPSIAPHHSVEIDDEEAPPLIEIQESAAPVESPGYAPTTPSEVPPPLEAIPENAIEVEDVEPQQPLLPQPLPEQAGDLMSVGAEPEPLPSTMTTPLLNPNTPPLLPQSQPYQPLQQPNNQLAPQPPQSLPQPPDTPFNQSSVHPDVLDGHYRPSRREGRAGRIFSGPYVTEIQEEEPWSDICPGMEESVRRLRLQELLSETSTDDEAVKEISDCYMVNPIHESFLTGKAVCSEISLKDLNAEERELFDVAMKKEWDSWMKFSAVEVLTPEQVEQLPGDTPIIGTRWVHVDKNKKVRMMASGISGKTKKTTEQISREYPLLAKSRIVVQGNQEEETGIRSDSPTASLLGFNLVCSVAVMKKWEVRAYDASTAYLQAKGISRLLILRPPRPPPPGIYQHDLLRAKGSIYGTKDAGRSWWIKLFKEAVKEGWISSKVEPAMFFLYSDTKELTGIMVTHVDDLFVAGVGEKYEQSMKKLTVELHLKENKGSFRFCGKNIKQDGDYNISLDQKDAIEAVEYQVISKDRRVKPNSPLTESEKSQFRGLIGSMGWISRQTRPDVMVNVSLASQTMGSPTVKDVVDLNKAVKMLKETPDEKWNFVASEMDLESCIVFTCADSSFANTEGHKSQCGYVVGLALPELPSGASTPVHILETHSGSIKRVCRSTLAAESNAVLMGAEAADYIRSLMVEMMNPGVSSRNLEREFNRKALQIYTDAKSLEATVTKDAGLPSDKRVRILVAQVKELLRGQNEPEAGGCSIFWVDTSQMLADVLTKQGCERELMLEVLSTGRWTLMPSEMALQKKAKIRMDRQARKIKEKHVKAEDG